VALMAEPPADLSHPVENYLSAGPGAIPEEALYGKAAEWARQTGLSMSTAYPAILATYSAVPRFNTILDVPFNLYTVLLMPVGGGKNLALNRATRVLQMIKGRDYQDATLGGVGGLWQALGEKKDGNGKDKITIPGPAKMLLNPAEFGATLANTRIDNSTLSYHLCNLWDQPDILLPTREGLRPVNCRLSILGALPVDVDEPEQFARYFAEETSHGLHSRFIFGFSDEKLDNRWAERWTLPEAVGDGSLESLIPKAPPTTPPRGWDPAAEQFYDQCFLPDDNDGRGMYNLKRIALLTATGNGDELVALAGVEAAWYFMLWQARLKRAFKVGKAQKTTGGELSDLILTKLRAIDEKGEYERSPVIEGRLNICLPRVVHKNHWEKYGSEAVQRTLASLIKLGLLRAGKKLNQKSKVVASEHHVVVTKFTD
jgi:hypothetical protein